MTGQLLIKETQLQRIISYVKLEENHANANARYAGCNVTHHVWVLLRI